MAPGRDHGPETQPEPMWVEAGVTFSVLKQNCFLRTLQRSSEVPGHVPGPPEHKLRIDEIVCFTPIWFWELCFLLHSLI